MPSVGRVLRLRWIVLIGTLWAVTAFAAPRRLGLVGPAREDPSWVAVQVGMRAAMDPVLDLSPDLDLLDRTPRVVDSATAVAAADTLLEQPLDALLFMPADPAFAAWRDVLERATDVGVPVFWIGENPQALPVAAQWTVAWEEWARALQIVAVDLAASRDGALIAYPGLRGTLSPAGWNALRSADHWPPTGLWRGFDPEVEAVPDSGGAVRVRVVGERARLIPSKQNERIRTLATFLDALALHRLADGTVDAVVAPHFIETGGAVVDKVREWRGGEALTARRFSIGPLVVTQANEAHWRAVWRRWEY